MLFSRSSSSQQWIFLGSSRKRIQIELTRCTWHKHRFGLKEFLWQKCMNLYTCATQVNATIHTHTRRYIHTQASRFLFKLSNFSFRAYNAYNIELHLGYTGSERDGYAYTNTNWSAYSKTCTSECILKVAKEMKKKWKWAPHVWILWIISNQFWVCLTIPNARVNRFDSETPARST